MPHPSHPPLFDHPNNIEYNTNHGDSHYAVFSSLPSLKKQYFDLKMLSFYRPHSCGNFVTA
jgi:hypothetical protein